jgi:hypothetical protein
MSPDVDSDDLWHSYFTVSVLKWAFPDFHLK